MTPMAANVWGPLVSYMDVLQWGEEELPISISSRETRILCGRCLLFQVSTIWGTPLPSGQGFSKTISLHQMPDSVLICVRFRDITLRMSDNMWSSQCNMVLIWSILFHWFLEWSQRSQIKISTLSYWCSLIRMSLFVLLWNGYTPVLLAQHRFAKMYSGNPKLLSRMSSDRC